MTTELLGQHTIPADHPSLAGHFPGNPIVPGVVLLECVVQTLRQQGQLQLGGARPSRFANVKFLLPLAPQTPFTVLLTQRSPLRWRFSCRAEAGELMCGDLEISADAA